MKKLNEEIKIITAKEVVNQADALYKMLDEWLNKREITKEAWQTYYLVKWVADKMSCQTGAEGIAYEVSLLDNNFTYNGESYLDIKTRYCKVNSIPDFELDLEGAKLIWSIKQFHFVASGFNADLED